jgi:hypothetical protein
MTSSGDKAGAPDRSAQSLHQRKEKAPQAESLGAFSRFKACGAATLP